MTGSEKPPSGALRWAAWWIVLCAAGSILPWILSPLGRLNARGYLVSLGLGGALLFGFRRRFGTIKRPRAVRTRWWRRFRRDPVFGVFLILAAAAVAGGILYPPANHDGLTYRFPRVLNWVWEGRWHWIVQPAESQMNLSGAGHEWLMTALFALTRSDRLFFLPNIVSYFLMPGAFFAVGVRLGVAPRVAARWMWLLPCGYGFALQAGSIGNDLIAAPFALAGLAFALRARRSAGAIDAALAILAAALITGTKLSNAPLVLPIGLALAGNPGWLRRRTALPLAATTLAGLAASALPILIACHVYTGHYSGDPANEKHLNLDNPVAGLAGNTLQVLSRNAMPPLNPAAGWWNARARGFLPEKLDALLRRDYPRFDLEWREFPQEESDGLGLGLSLLAGFSGVAAVFCRRKIPRPFHAGNDRLVIAGIAVATLVYLAKMGSEAAPRLLLPYYPLLALAVLRSRVNVRLVRSRGWRIAAFVAACCALPAVVLSPCRPLLPMRGLLGALPDSIRDRPNVFRMRTVYDTYAARNDAMAPLRRFLPANAGRIGFIGDGRSLRVGLWRPFGSRKVETVGVDAGAAELSDRGIGALVVDERMVKDVEKWAADRRLRLSGRAEILNYAGKTPERYRVYVPETGEK
ncbi:MAG: hypothetical protein KDM91_08385 [Verrucomicrobiae bacterium]|nr:hypothetical protein [Verrucomicrobiae bacterium]